MATNSHPYEVYGRTKKNRPLVRKRELTREEFETNFWRRVKRGKPDECWPWLGSFTGKNYRDKEKAYGQLSWNDKKHRAHRVAYFLAYNFNPPMVCHSCDNPPCCNPAHLFAGDNTTNMADAASKGRCKPPQKHFGLSLKKAKLARFLYEIGYMKQVALALLFKVSYPYMNRLLNYKTKHGNKTPRNRVPPGYHPTAARKTRKGLGKSKTRRTFVIKKRKG